MKISEKDRRYLSEKYELSNYFLDELEQFLNTLRESGDTNMMGAVPYIQAEFGIDRYAAKAVLFAWMGRSKN